MGGGAEADVKTRDSVGAGGFTVNALKPYACIHGYPQKTAYAGHWLSSRLRKPSPVHRAVLINARKQGCLAPTAACNYV
jgi:hypothetical protein